MMLTTAIFDFGGVLTTDLWESIREGTQRRGLPRDAILGYLRGAGRDQFHALERGDIDQATFESGAAEALGTPADGLIADMVADLRGDEAMLDTLAELRANGVRTAILSNSCGQGYCDPYAPWDVDTMVDLVVISHHVRMSKPDPAIYRLTLDKLGVEPAECLFVDDVESNTVTAATLGMTAIHHTDSGRTVAELRRLLLPGT